MGNLNEWLNNPDRDYRYGVSLYASVRYNRNILNLLQRKESAANMAKLLYELGKFSDVKPEPVKRIVADVSDIMQKPMAQFIDEMAATNEKKQSVMFHDLPEELRPVLLDANALWRENCLLKVGLNEQPEDAEDECLRIQMKIDDNWKRNAMCWKKIDYWLEHRAIPENVPSDFEKLTPEKRWGRRQLLYQSISKLNKRIEANRNQLETETHVPTVAKLTKAVAKAEANLISQESDVLVLTRLIDGIDG